MNRRLAIYELVSENGLSETQAQHLAAAVGVGNEPEWLAGRLPQALAQMNAAPLHDRLTQATFVAQAGGQAGVEV